MKKKLSIIIPAYNEEATISVVINSVLTLEFERYGFEKEIIIVDDGSSDSTFNLARKSIDAFRASEPESNNFVKLIKHQVNRGKGAAIRTALQSVTGDIVAIQDADMEYHPSDILSIASSLIESGADVVYGSRFLKKNPVIYGRYYLGNKLISAVISLLFLKKVTDAYTCRKVFKRDFLENIKLESEGFEIEAEITSKILRSAAAFLEIPIDYKPRRIEEGKKISWKDAVKGFFTAIKYRFVSKKNFLSPPWKPRICILSARFYPHLGGTEKQALEVAALLKSDGYDMMALTQRHFKDLPEEEMVKGIKIHRLSCFVYSRFLSSVIFMARAIVFLLRNRKRYDLILALLASSPALAACLVGAFLRDKKIVIKLGGARGTGDIATSRRTLWGRLKLFFLKKSKAVFVCPSDEVRSEALAVGFPSRRIVIIPNGVDTVKFSPPLNIGEKSELRRKLNIPETAAVITYIGRFTQGKGIESLLDIFCDEIEKKFPHSALLMVGEGELKKIIEQRCAKTNGKIFVSAAAVDNVRDYLAASDIFVLFSSGEGLSNSLLEAMSVGLGVVVSDIEANRGIISDGENGLLVPVGDKALLSEAIKRLLSDDKLRCALGLSARKTVSEHYDIKKTADMYKKLYSSSP